MVKNFVICLFCLFKNIVIIFCFTPINSTFYKRKSLYKKISYNTLEHNIHNLRNEGSILLSRDFNARTVVNINPLFGDKQSLQPYERVQQQTEQTSASFLSLCLKMKSERETYLTMMLSAQPLMMISIPQLPGSLLSIPYVRVPEREIKRQQEIQEHT